LLGINIKGIIYYQHLSYESNIEIFFSHFKRSKPLNFQLIFLNLIRDFFLLQFQRPPCILCSLYWGYWAAIFFHLRWVWYSTYKNISGFLPRDLLRFFRWQEFLNRHIFWKPNTSIKPYGHFWYQVAESMFAILKKVIKKEFNPDTNWLRPTKLILFFVIFVFYATN